MRTIPTAFARGGGVLLALLLCLTLPPTAALAVEQPIGYGL